VTLPFALPTAYGPLPTEGLPGELGHDRETSGRSGGRGQETRAQPGGKLGLFTAIGKGTKTQPFSKSTIVPESRSGMAAFLPCR